MAMTPAEKKAHKERILGNVDNSVRDTAVYNNESFNLGEDLSLVFAFQSTCVRAYPELKEQKTRGNEIWKLKMGGRSVTGYDTGSIVFVNLATIPPDGITDFDKEIGAEYHKRYLVAQAEKDAAVAATVASHLADINEGL